jgi:hypothetical protein
VAAFGLGSAARLTDLIWLDVFAKEDAVSVQGRSMQDFVPVPRGRGPELPAPVSPCFAWSVRALRRKIAYGLLLAATGVVSSACGGKVDADGLPVPGDVPADSVGFDTGECPPAQWDCSGVPVSCDWVGDETGQPLPTISLGGTCRCDLSRPKDQSDCGSGELFVCGSLSFDSSPGDVHSFEPVSCRCAVNAGYYCSHCTLTGLYASADDAAGCGLDAVDEGTAVYCGCGL